MTLPDQVQIALGNLWRMKLRSFLTVSGVVIAIGSFVAMLSFGAGNRQYVTDQFNQLGLLHTIHVYPKRETSTADTAAAPVLDQRALERLAAIPGVNLAYPLDAFPVKATVADSQVATSAQALSLITAHTQLYNHLVAGRWFPNDSVREAVISETLLEKLGIHDPDSLLGRSLVVSAELATLDSGLVSVFRDPDGSRRRRLHQVDLDSLLSSRAYAENIARTELNDAVKRFFSGYMENRLKVSETLSVVGVLERRVGYNGRAKEVIVPSLVALRLNTGGINTDPTNLVAALSSGNLFAPVSDSLNRSYSQVTLDFDPRAPYRPIKDSIEAMGYRCFSYAEEFEQFRRFAFYFDLMLGVIGLVAIITASLGIVNTMVMSIIERRREIGVLKSLGADQADIRMLFLVESGVIGTLGAAGGILLGWVVTRIISAIARSIMTKQGLDPVELFRLPLWLILLALGFGLLVSIAAGLFPAIRAARVDPVEALRQE